MKITVIGSGDAFGSGGRLNTCFHIRTSGAGVLLDCGATILQGLHRNQLGTNDIDTIFISHFHGDHYGGLPYFLLDAATFGRSKPLAIVSPHGCKNKVAQLLDLLYPGTEVLRKLTLQFIEYQPMQEINVDAVRMTPYPVVHTPATSAHGLRLNVSGKIISYSGDTGWTENLVQLSSHSDLFICECNFFETEAAGHLSHKTLKEKLASLDCAKILLTHFGNEMIKNMGEVTLPCAFDGMSLEI